MSASLSGDPDVDQILLPDKPISSLDKTLQIKITSCFWGQRPSNHENRQFSPYFRYFTSECEAWRLSGNSVALHNYRDLLGLVEYLKHNSTEPRTTLQMQMLASRSSDTAPESVRNALYLAVRLWLMLNVGPRDLTLFHCRSTLEWTEDQSLQTLIATTFPQTQMMPTAPRWQRSLNAYNLTRIGGFEIVWTDHLPDHLYLNEDLGSVSLYHHAFILQQHKNQEPHE